MNKDILQALKNLVAAIDRYESDDTGSRTLADFIYDDDDLLTPARKAIQQAEEKS